MKYIILIIQTEQILQRHLKIGEALSIEQLVQRTKDNGGVRMLRGFYDLKFTKDGEGKRNYEFFSTNPYQKKRKYFS